VWVRDPEGRVVSVHADGGRLTLTFHPGPGVTTDAPPWADRLSALMAELSNTPTNQERSNTP
jgi:hypothetical protein